MMARTQRSKRIQFRIGMGLFVAAFIVQCVNLVTTVISPGSLFQLAMLMTPPATTLIIATSGYPEILRERRRIRRLLRHSLIRPT